ncbi:ABC transporter permease subunit [Candidatus Gracilibacteria bacterium]|nr:ABC transporter permease subunit [Candidatus Gracilibacteria bacterium]
MDRHAIHLITRREIRETLSDWRIVTPIVVLAFLLPLLLVAASNLVVTFVADQRLAERLVPFAALLVGFVPASFSLITALESFVGERERNTLESLLAMPLGDRALYLGKFVSALATPLASSMAAMTIFTVLLALAEPTLYFAAMTLPRLALLYLLVISMALVMVAGAVVISSHITSIRAANLMSAFILLPMAAAVQTAAFFIINDQWTLLWLMTAGLAVLACGLVRIGVVSFSREEILSREQLQGQFGLRLFGAKGGSRSLPSFVGSPALVIMRRELVEMLSDWRMLVPLVMLIFGLPTVMVVGTGVALNYLESELILGPLVPFAALLVGFVPASFALVAALESFVGERERNSLESLLSMPITDQGLYTGKLIAALVVPLVASWLAMTTFLVLFRLSYPAIYALDMTPSLITILALMVALLNLVMVSAAVVISSHTGSIRAATLLASFVLVPVSVLIQIQALLFIAQRYDLVQVMTAAVAVVAVALIRTGMLTFSREEILSREHEPLNVQHVVAMFRRFFSEYQPAGVAANAYVGLPFAPLRFYRYELPTLLRDLRLPLLLVMLGVLVGTVFGALVGARFTQLQVLLANVGSAPPPSFGFAAEVFVNNLRVSLLSNIVSIFTFGVFAFLVPSVAFAQVGFVSSALGGSWFTLGPASPTQFLLAYVLPHGIIELPVFMLSAAWGLRIGASLLAPPPGFTVGENLLWALANWLKTWLLLIAPLVLLAALIEGFVTPLVVTWLYGELYGAARCARTAGANLVDMLITSFSAKELVDRMRRGVLSPVDVVEAFIARIEAVNPALNAVVAQRFDLARREAAALIKHAERGPLLACRGRSKTRSMSPRCPLPVAGSAALATWPRVMLRW